MIEFINNNSDITFCVPVFIDSKSRKKNYNTFFSYWKDKVNILFYNFKNQSGFYRSRIHNYLAKRVETPFMALVDIDCIIPEEQIKSACNMLSSGVDFILPYDQSIQDVNTKLKIKGTWPKYKIDHEFIKNHFNESINWNIPEIIETHIHKGLIFCAKVDSFLSFGLENEYFIGWGFEDEERIERACKLDFIYKRVSGPCYHLMHPKTKTSRQNDLWKNNFFELFKIKAMNKLELKQYIQTWKWNRKNA